MVEPIYCLKPAWCGRHLAGLRPETGLTVRYGATAFKAVGYHFGKASKSAERSAEHLALDLIHALTRTLKGPHARALFPHTGRKETARRMPVPSRQSLMFA